MRHLICRALVIVGLAASLVVIGDRPAEAATTLQTAFCVDRSGHFWQGQSLWGAAYTDEGGIRRVQNNWTGFTAAATDATTVDYTIKTYNADGSLAQLIGEQDRRVNFALGTAYLQRNPQNPVSGPGRTKIVLNLGDGDDGRGNCTMTFLQPLVQPVDELDGQAVDEPGGQGNGQPTVPVDSPTIPSFLTGYTWWDNSPPGSGAIAHPVLHQTAGGVGTYADPITLAVGYTSAGPFIPYGTRLYFPNLKKYVIVEDICGACGTPPADVTYRLDIWLDARRLSAAQAHACAARNTGNQPVVQDPPDGLPTSTAPLC
jgi:3D (Asp-Asp-Asp) domain-containing protein